MQRLINLGLVLIGTFSTVWVRVVINVYKYGSSWVDTGNLLDY